MLWDLIQTRFYKMKCQTSYVIQLPASVGTKAIVIFIMLRYANKKHARNKMCSSLKYPINIVGVYTNIFTMVTNPNNLGKNFKKKSLAHLEGCRNKNNHSSPGVDLMKSFALVKCTLTGQGQQHKTANSSTRI